VPVVDGFHVVAVEIAQEDAIIARMVFRPLTRGVQDLGTGRHGRLMDRIHGVAGRGPERNVKFPGLGTMGLAQPEVRNAVGTAEADDKRIAVRKADRLAHPDRGESTQVEVE